MASLLGPVAYIEFISLLFRVTCCTNMFFLKPDSLNKMTTLLTVVCTIYINHIYCFPRRVTCLRGWSLNGTVRPDCCCLQITTRKRSTCGPQDVFWLRCSPDECCSQVRTQHFLLLFCKPRGSTRTSIFIIWSLRATSSG